MTDHLPLLTAIKKDGQPYVDEPVYETFKPKKLSVAVQVALDVFVSKPLNVLVSYNHIKLNWIKPK